MSINYYNKRLDQGIFKIDEFSFDTSDLSQKIDSEVSKLKNPSKILIRLKFLVPNEDTNYIRDALFEKKLKSHEVKEVVSQLSKKIHNSLISKVINYNKSLENFVLFRDIVLNFSSKSAALTQPNYDKNRTKSTKKKKRTVLEVAISVSDHSNFSAKDLAGLIKLFLSDEAHYAESCRVLLYNVNSKELFMRHEVSKVFRRDLKQFLTLQHKENLVEYYSTPLIKELIFDFLFPNPTSITRITLDKLQERLPVKKSLRIEKYKDEYIKIVEMRTHFR